MKVIQFLAPVLILTAGGGCGAAARRHVKDFHSPVMRVVTVPAQPRSLELDLQRTAVLVVDMQNDFVMKGGLLDQIGYETAGIQKIVPPIREVLELARKAGLPIVYLKMGYRPDLSDIGSEDSPMGIENRRTNVGGMARSPDGREGRFLIRDTWNTDIVDELKPRPGDIVVYKTRYSGFYKTELDRQLRRRGIRSLIVTGCTTRVCVESTVRDAMFRDYMPVILADCTYEPIGDNFPRNNHKASLFLIQAAPFGSVSTSAEFAKALAVLLK